MKLTLDLATDESIAVRYLAHELDVDLPAAAQRALRDWLIGNGYLELLNDNKNAEGGYGTDSE